MGGDFSNGTWEVLVLKIKLNGLLKVFRASSTVFSLEGHQVVFAACFSNSL
jgi:hypothetical protein